MCQHHLALVKTSLVNALVKSRSDIKLSVSHTTRLPREGEVDGQDYYFVDDGKFIQMRDAGEFLELAKVFDNFYATSYQSVMTELDKGYDVILEIDWQGARKVRSHYPHCASIFILPPSKHTLEKRLRGRNQDNDDIIARRMRDAENEIAHYAEFDYLVVNEDFDEALAYLTAIVLAHRQSIMVQRQKQANLLADLLA